MRFAANRPPRADDLYPTTRTFVFARRGPPRRALGGEISMSERLLPYLLVGVGGFVGANARFVMARWVGSFVEGRFPLGTFLINVSGSFLLGMLGALVSQRLVPNADALRLALGVGFLGAFTTFSTFEYETLALF